MTKKPENEWWTFFKSHFWLFFIFAGFFFSGMYLDTKLCQNKCNRHIVENIYPEEYNSTHELPLTVFYDDSKLSQTEKSELQETESLLLNISPK